MAENSTRPDAITVAPLSAKAMTVFRMVFEARLTPIAAAIAGLPLPVLTATASDPAPASALPEDLSSAVTSTLPERAATVAPST